MIEEEENVRYCAMFNDVHITIVKDICRNTGTCF